MKNRLIGLKPKDAIKQKRLNKHQVPHSWKDNKELFLIILKLDTFMHLEKQKMIQDVEQLIQFGQ